MKNRRSPSLDATPVLSPGIAKADVRVGLGAVARCRGIGWRSGLAAVFRVYYNQHNMFSEICLDITTTTEEHHTILYTSTEYHTIYS